MNNHCEDPETGDTIHYTSDSWVNTNEAPVSLELLEGGTIEVPAEVAKKIGDGKSVSVEMFPDHWAPDPEVSDLYAGDAEKPEEEIPARGAKNVGRDNHEFVTLGLSEKVDPAKIAEELSRGLKYAPGTRSVHNKGEASMEPDWAGEDFEYSSPHTTRPRLVTGPNTTKPDIINHPAHYAAGRQYEPKDVIRDWGLNYNLGAAVKYISRLGRKNDAIEDIDKAIAYLGFEREALLKEKENE